MTEKMISLLPWQLKKIREIIGDNEGTIDLASGKLIKKEELQSQKTIKKIVGNNFGAEVIAKASLPDGQVSHVVVVSKKDNLYTCAKVILNAAYVRYNPLTHVILKKGIDVLYKNPTYKEWVIVDTSEVYEIEYDSFIRIPCMIEGKVINDRKMKSIKYMVKTFSREITVGKKEAISDNTGDNQGNGLPESNENGKDDSETEKENTKKYEDVLKDVSTVEELLTELNVTNDELKFAVNRAINMPKYTLKELIRTEVKTAYSGKSQKAIKERLIKAYSQWKEASDYSIRYDSLSYFLRTIVKNFK